jgi:predicted amidohydrolase
MKITAGIVQLNSGDDPTANLQATCAYISEAAERGAQFVLTPEVTNIISADRAQQNRVLQIESQDKSLSALRALAAKYRIWLLIGSLALKTGDPDGRFTNRSILVSPLGKIAARYDKIHMFDARVSDTETYRESAGYRPGNRAVVANTDFGPLGMTICYDLRFPYLMQHLAQAGARMIAVPSAFSPVTGAAHWQVLLRARAIETGAFVLAPAQTGKHGPKRETYGHSLVVDPWGKVLLDAGTNPGAFLVNLDLNAVKRARDQIPVLSHIRTYQGPDDAN